MRTQTGQSGRQFEAEIEPFFVNAELEDAEAVASQRRQVAVDGLEGEFAGLHFGKVQDVVEQEDQRLRGALCSQQLFAVLGILNSVQHQADHARHTIHRRADLVAHIGQEFALEAGGLLGVFLGGAQLDIDPLALDAFPFQFGIAARDFVQHAVERFGEHSQFVLGRHGHTLLELVSDGDTLGHFGNRQDGRRYPRLQEHRQNRCDQQAEQDDEGRAPQVLAQHLPDGEHTGREHQRAPPFAVGPDGVGSAPQRPDDDAYRLEGAAGSSLREEFIPAKQTPCES